MSKLLLILMLVSCQTTVSYSDRLRYGQRVKVVRGFFTGVEGELNQVREYWATCHVVNIRDRRFTELWVACKDIEPLN